MGATHNSRVLATQLTRASQPTSAVTRLFQEAEKQGKADKLKRILDSAGVDPQKLQRENKRIADMVEQLPKNALLLLSQEFLLAIKSDEGELVGMSQQGIVFGSDSKDNGVLTAADDAFLFIQDKNGAGQGQLTW